MGKEGCELGSEPEVSPIKCDVRECVVRTSDSRQCIIRMRNCRSNGRFYVLMADFTMGNGTFYRNGVNFGECDILTTHSRESYVLTTHSLTSHFIGETSALQTHRVTDLEWDGIFCLFKTTISLTSNM